MTITFGGNGFFGYVYSSSSKTDANRDSPNHISSPGDTITWWSTYGTDECPDPKTIDKAAINQDLKERHADWKDPVIREIVASVEVETMWPTWTTPELPLWDKDGIILLGDAAHALPPTSGQGSAQALEDVESLSLFLSHYLKKAYGGDPSGVTERDAINLAAKKHMALREPHVKAILDEARQRQRSKKSMNIVQEFMMYLILYLVGKWNAISGVCLDLSLLISFLGQAVSRLRIPRKRFWNIMLQMKCKRHFWKKKTRSTASYQSLL